MDRCKAVAGLRLTACALLLVPVAALAAEPEPPRPLGDPATWVTAMDYPSQALRNEAEGVASFVLAIDPAGRVAACDITGSSGTPLLDQQTCELLRQRATFSPARDAAGQPVPGTYRNRVRWVIPYDPPPEPSELVLSFRVEPDGRRTDCKLERAEGAAARELIADNPCGKGRFERGYVDQQGQRVARRVRATMKLEVLPDN